MKTKRGTGLRTGSGRVVGAATAGLVLGVFAGACGGGVRTEQLGESKSSETGTGATTGGEATTSQQTTVYVSNGTTTTLSSGVSVSGGSTVGSSSGVVTVSGGSTVASLCTLSGSEWACPGLSPIPQCEQEAGAPPTISSTVPTYPCDPYALKQEQCLMCGAGGRLYLLTCSKHYYQWLPETTKFACYQ